jgi:hypothetical protein
MSNKTQLQTNNTKYASLIDTLRGKSLPTGGEDVTTETNAYTEKLASLETAITALESELAGKASGGGSGDVECVTVVISGTPMSTTFITYVDKQISTQQLVIDDTATEDTIITILAGTFISVYSPETGFEDIRTPVGDNYLIILM